MVTLTYINTLSCSVDPAPSFVVRQRQIAQTAVAETAVVVAVGGGVGEHAAAHSQVLADSRTSDRLAKLWHLVVDVTQGDGDVAVAGERAVAPVRG